MSTTKGTEQRNSDAHFDFVDDATVGRWVADQLIARKVSKVADGRYWQWTGTHWVEYDDEQGSRRISAWLLSDTGPGGGLVGATHGLGTTFTDHAGQPFKLYHRLRVNARAVESWITVAGHYLRDADFFAPELVPYGINCRSGFLTFNASTGEVTVKPHAPEQRQRYQLNASYTGKPGKATLLRAFLAGSFSRDREWKSKIGFLAEVAGVMLAGIGPQTKKLVVLYGPNGDEGKSQIAEMLCSLLPRNTVTNLTPQNCDNMNAREPLRSSLLNCVTDLANKPLPMDDLKRIICGEPFEVKRLYRDAEPNARSRALHLYCSNHLPDIRSGHDAGTDNRVVILPFAHSVDPSRRVPDIGRRVAESEADALLFYAVRGAQRVIRNGYRYSCTEWGSQAENDDDDGDSVMDAFRASDPVRRFVTETCSTGSGAATSRWLYASYLAWCSDSGVRPDNENLFAQRASRYLTALGARRTNKLRRLDGGQARGWRNLQVAAPYDADSLLEPYISKSKDEPQHSNGALRDLILRLRTTHPTNPSGASTQPEPGNTSPDCVDMES